jgi:hypothetical protein
MMTIEVYRINPRTGTRTQVRGKRTIKPADAPEAGEPYPRCTCPRRKNSAQELRAKVSEANRRSRGEL